MNQNMQFMYPRKEALLSLLTLLHIGFGLFPSGFELNKRITTSHNLRKRSQSVYLSVTNNDYDSTIEADNLALSLGPSGTISKTFRCTADRGLIPVFKLIVNGRLVERSQRRKVASRPNQNWYYFTIRITSTGLYQAVCQVGRQHRSLMSNMVRLVVVQQENAIDDASKNYPSIVQLFSPTQRSAEIINVDLCYQPAVLVKLRCLTKASTPPSFSLMLDNNPTASNISVPELVKRSMTDDAYWYDFIATFNSGGNFAAVCSAEVNGFKNFSNTIFVDVHAPEMVMAINSFSETSGVSTSIVRPLQSVKQGSSVSVSCSATDDSSDSPHMKFVLQCRSLYNYNHDEVSGSSHVYLHRLQAHDSPVTCTCVMHPQTCPMKSLSRSFRVINYDETPSPVITTAANFSEGENAAVPMWLTYVGFGFLLAIISGLIALMLIYKKKKSFVPVPKASDTQRCSLPVDDGGYLLAPLPPAGGNTAISGQSAGQSLCSGRALQPPAGVYDSPYTHVYDDVSYGGEYLVMYADDSNPARQTTPGSCENPETEGFQPAEPEYESV